MNNNLSPVVLFTYNRPVHTKNVLDSLALNNEAKESDLFIFCDGAKENATEEIIAKISEVRKIVSEENRFKSVTVKIQDKNKGLANSIIEGVTEVVNKYGKIIVLEDDLVFSPYFLNYMNDSLNRYESEKQIAQIGGCNFFANGDKFPKTFVATMPDTWGWATWKDRWQHFNPDAIYLYKQLEKEDLMYRFNAYGTYEMKKMLMDQILGNVDSWAIRWQAVMVLNNWYCLYSNPAFSNHIESTDATHAPVNILPPLATEQLSFSSISVEELPQIVEALKKGYSGEGDYYGNLKTKFKRRKIKSIFKKFFSFFIPHGIVMLFKKNK